MAKINKAAEKWVGNSGMKRLLVELEPEMHTKLKSFAAEENVSMTDIIRKLVKKHLHM